ncbi:MAG: lysine transporter LysE, partial [Bdellovibrionales bacterium]
MVAAPVGPVGLLCIRRTLRKGLLNGFATGFGAAFADALFSAVAAFGLAT